MANHLQLLVITLNFDLDWPTQVNQLNDSAKPLADVSSRIISIDCFLDQVIKEVNHRIYYLSSLYLFPYIPSPANLLGRHQLLILALEAK